MKPFRSSLLPLVVFSAVTTASAIAEANQNQITVTLEAELPGYPRDISDGNYVVGFSNGDWDWEGAPELSRAGFRWSQEGAEANVEWLTAPNLTQSELYAVNDNGDAVGTACFTHSGCQAVFWKADGEIVKLNQEVDREIAKFIAENQLGSNPSNFPYDVNVHGEVFGFTNFFTHNGARGILAWTWSNNEGLTILPGGGGEPQGFERVSAGNINGIAVGGAYDEFIPDGEFASYWDTANTHHKLDVPEALYPYGSVAMSVNNSGDIVGVDASLYTRPWTINLNDPSSFTQLTESPYGATSIDSITEGGMILGSARQVMSGYYFDRPQIWDTEGNLYDINEYYQADSHNIGGSTNIGLNHHRLLVAPKQEIGGSSYIGAAVFRIHGI
ncbi:hypothetical protein HRJ45_05400 [Vibrio coralliilyticus]|uniref:hypothetical protein n=1 Tax=Vibrio coralliilyticus TaxID=190893 RepID=UPI00148BBCD5|nr:hypothetical protein [Vibrio coralliilyticus]NOH53832.1 hypothetical protein [Vibrio coralliilyticus]NRF24950.1 hypothetical protein [Vibrio coralliilyticus]NRF78528.1 hypothetical protein [Vibrio coralliilyticus]